MGGVFGQARGHVSQLSPVLCPLHAKRGCLAAFGAHDHQPQHGPSCSFKFTCPPSSLLTSSRPLRMPTPPALLSLPISQDVGEPREMLLRFRVHCLPGQLVSLLSFHCDSCLWKCQPFPSFRARPGYSEDGHRLWFLSLRCPSDLLQSAHPQGSTLPSEVSGAGDGIGWWRLALPRPDLSAALAS